MNKYFTLQKCGVDQINYWSYGMFLPSCLSTTEIYWVNLHKNYSKKSKYFTSRQNHRYTTTDRFVRSLKIEDKQKTIFEVIFNTTAIKWTYENVSHKRTWKVFKKTQESLYNWHLHRVVNVKWTWNEREDNLSHVHSRSWSENPWIFEPDSWTELNWT